MTFNELIGCNTYPCYGGGGILSTPWPPFTISGHDVLKADGQRVFTIDKMYPFKLQRFFIDNFMFNEGPPVTLQTEPTPGNFWIDTYFKLCKANGIKTWWATAGVFSWHKMPINPATGKEYSRRKSMPIPPGADPFTKEAWDEISELQRQIGAHYNGTGLLDYLELVGNECFDFPWNTVLKGTPEIVAEGVYWCYKAVRSVNQELKLILPSGTSWNLERLREVPFYVKKKFESMGEQMPTDLYHTSHNYLRNNSQSQGAGTTGITPEDARMHEWIKGMESICIDYNLLGVLVGESGYGTDNDAQHAPDIEGFDRGMSQGVCNLRFAAILGTSPYFKGVTFYHCRDLFDLGAYDYTGYSDKDWKWKKAMLVTVDFKEKYGDFSPVSYSFANEISTLKIQRGDEIKWLQWANKNNIGELTPNFKEVTEPQIPMRNIKKSGSTLVWSDTGERIIIKELNSPETLLRQSLADFKAIVDYASSVGLNTIYCTLYAGDKYSATLHPYNGTKVIQFNGLNKTVGNPSSGFNMPSLNDWKVKLEYAASKGMIIHPLLSEKENHHVHTSAEGHAQIDMMIEQFDHLPVIWDREEVPLGMDGFIIDQYTYLKSKTKNITAIHNNTGEKPWVGHSDIIDLLSIQAGDTQFDSIIKAETANGFSAYSSEVVQGIAAGDTAKAARIRDAGGSLSSGAGAYLPPLDQDATLAQLKAYESVLKTISNTQTTPPTPTTMIIGYSTKADRSDFKEIVAGQPLPVGSLYLEARSATPPVVFTLKTKAGAILKQQTENGAPFDVHGGQAWNAPAGEYVLTVSDKNNAPKDYPFTVGTTTPPPVEIEGKRFFKNSDGKGVLEFIDGSKIVLE